MTIAQHLLAIAEELEHGPTIDATSVIAELRDWLVISDGTRDGDIIAFRRAARLCEELH